jgi:hypothetical protein
LFGSGHYLVAGWCEHGNAKLGFMKAEEFADHLSNYYLLKKDSKQSLI